MAKIVHITTAHQVNDTRIFHKQCKFIANSGFDLTLVTSQFGEPTEFMQDQVRIRTIKKRKNRLLRFLLSGWDAYRVARSIQDVDIYHYHDPELWYVGLLLKKKHNTVVYDVHEDYEQYILDKRYIPNLLKPLVRFLVVKIEAFVTRHFEIVLAEKVYRERFPQGNCILNYPKLSAEDLPSQPLRKASKAQDGSIKLIYTGNVTIDRGALYHASLPELHPLIQVYFYGRCHVPFANQLNETFRSNRNRLYFEETGRYIPREEIDLAYQSELWVAGLAIFPYIEHYSKKELTKFFEYMYAEIPIICSNFPYWKEFIETHQCGIVVDPNNKEEILQAILYLYEHPEEAKEMGRRGRKAVENSLNWNVEGSKLVALYHQFIAKNRRVI